MFNKSYMEFMIRKATNKDIVYIEEILQDVVLWMHDNGIGNLWNKDNIKWNHLSRMYEIGDFYIAFYKDMPVACMAITDYDSNYWNEIPKGESLYIHKLAVKRMYAGMGISTKLIDFSKNLAYRRKIETIRLDCNKQRTKLCKLYENNGFRYEKEKFVAKNYLIALYVCNLK